MQSLFMIGDSLIEYGNWSSLLPEFDINNRGWAGETVEGLSSRLSTEIESLSEIDFFFIMTGTNNLAMEDYYFPAIIQTFLPKISMVLPKTQIIVNSLFPMQIPWIETQTISQVNQDLQNVTQQSGAYFLDIVPSFHNYCGQKSNNCFSPDGVHLNDNGYEFWAKEISKHLHSHQPCNKK